MNPLLVSSAILLGVAIGWILATQIHDLAWGKLYKTQRLTAVCQKEALKLQAEYTVKLEQIILERQGLRQEWEKATSELQSAVEIRERAIGELEMAKARQEQTLKDAGSR